MRLRRSARVIVINADQEILLVKYENVPSVHPERSGNESYWVLPGGAIEPLTGAPLPESPLLFRS